ncbi:hypothetical protein [Mycolicibacterium sp.]|uniref:hypothetical protein n=1 Tax=Mycolicibacterium sp. TaxID=2320850 RepID=UPI0037C56687
MRGGPIATDLKIGRPANRTRRYTGDRRSILEEGLLWGPDAHGVFWRPLRAYFDDPNSDGVGETLVILAPVHPDGLPAEVRR